MHSLVRFHRQVAATLACIVSAASGRAEGGGKGFVWDSPIAVDCPFERSPSLTGVYFTGRHSDYKTGDTFYPSWASDGNLYSPWTDGVTDGVRCSSGGGLANGFRTGHAVMTGDDPLALEISNTSPPKQALGAPYRGRYPCGTLVHDGIWYYGTYCLGPAAEFIHEGFKWNWPNLGPMPGFHISRDFGRTWEPTPEAINRLASYEFFGGHDANGEPVWTGDFEKIKPLLFSEFPLQVRQ